MRLRLIKCQLDVHDNDYPFTRHALKLEKGDTLYVFSDGYVDQFGGPKGKKFLAKRFKRLLLSMQAEDIQNHEGLLRINQKKWMGTHEQVDDVLVLGVRI